MIEIKIDFSTPAFKRVNEKHRPILELLEGHSSKINAGLISSDNLEVVTAAGAGSFGTKDNTIRIWSIQQKQQLRILKGHKCKIVSLSLTSTKKFLFSGDIKGVLIIWDYLSGSISHKSKLSDEIKRIYYNDENDQLIVFQNEQFKVFQFKSHSTENILECELTSAYSYSFIPHSLNINTQKKQYELVISLSGHSIRLIDYNTNEILNEVDLGRQIDTNCVVDSSNHIAIFGIFNEVIFWDYCEKLQVFQYSHKYPVYSVNFVEDYKKVVSCTLFSTQIWDYLEKVQLFNINYVGKLLHISNDLKYLLTCRLKNVGLYCFAEKRYKDLFKVHNSVIICAFTLEQKGLIFTLGADNYVKLWDSNTLNLCSQYILPRSIIARQIRLSIGLKYLIVSTKMSAIVLKIDSVLLNPSSMSEDIQENEKFSEYYVDNDYDISTYSQLVSWKM